MRTEEEVVHLFALRLSRKILSLIEPGLRPDVKHDLWQGLYDAIRTDLERHERERAA